MLVKVAIGISGSLGLAAVATAHDFEQPYGFSPDPGSFSSSAGQQAADEFVLPAAVHTTDIWWYGSFASGDPFRGFDIMQFELRIYRDAGGEPASRPFRQFGSFIAGVELTGIHDVEGRMVYRFFAMDWTLNLPANELLYISILEDDPRFAPHDYRWSNSTVEQDDLNWVRQSNADEWNAIGGFRGQSAFGMVIPGPGAAGAFLLAWIFTSCRQRRSRCPLNCANGF